MFAVTNEQLQMLIAKHMSKKMQVQVFDEVTSTNAVLKKMAEKQAPDGMVIIARQQTAGRGTQGRKFYSPRNGLYLSLLVRAQLDVAKSSYLTVATAVAVVKTLKKVFGVKCGIKWVNDIIYQGKKVGGILTEGELENGSQQLKYAVIGIGLNLVRPESGFHDEIAGLAGELLSTVPTAEKYCKLVADLVNNAYRLYQKLGKASLIRLYRRYSVLKNKEIKFLKNGKAYVGRVQEIDQLARLVVKVKGETVKLNAGEVLMVK